METVNIIPRSYKLVCKIHNKSNNDNPKYETSGASGFDIRAWLERPLTIKSGEYTLVPTGLYFDLPIGLDLQIRSRSGLAFKNGVVVLNSPGTVDNDYKGEVKILLINHGKEDFLINNGDRIAQGVFSSLIAERIVDLSFVDGIDDNTTRSTNGFGSTGIK
jgi:dUTP pyrophosphatase